MSASQLDSKENVILFLIELRRILTSCDFDINNDLDILPKKANENPLDPYTTANTLAELEFDKNDVKEQLLSVDVRDYVETIIDDKDDSLPPFFVFCKEIQKRDVYIKVKIRDRINGKIFCVSFHFARYLFKHPLPYES
jgi:hypothetical protein